MNISKGQSFLEKSERHSLEGLDMRRGYTGQEMPNMELPDTRKGGGEETRIRFMVALKEEMQRLGVAAVSASKGTSQKEEDDR